MRHISERKAKPRAGVVAICGNPNSGKTTIFNAITGLNQKVGNYPGVTVEKVTGRFFADKQDRRRFEIVDVPGTYSLAAFSPDEYIAASTLYGGIGCEERPDVLICVVDATNLRRGLYLVLQVLQIGRPVIVALNMTDLVARRKIEIDAEALSEALGGLPVVPVTGNKGRGIDRLKLEAVRMVESPVCPEPRRFDEATERLIEQLEGCLDDGDRTRAEYLRIIHDLQGPAEQQFMEEALAQGRLENARAILQSGRAAIEKRFGSLSLAETSHLTARATEICELVVRNETLDRKSTSERLDRWLLHPILGPIFLVAMMTLVFQSIFSWAEPFMEMIDGAFGMLAGLVEGAMPEGPVRSLLTDGVIGGVGSVLVFLPQIIILFLFIALLEDSGYMSRAAFLVDRMFRWCGLSGKSFIPMLSSFACAIPGIMATRTIEDRKLRLITIMVAPLMTCSARLPVYAIMIAAFVPHRTYLGLFNLQGLVLTTLYLLGVVVAVLVSFVLQKTILRTQRGSFMMEMPSYKVPTWPSVIIRVLNRAKSFVIRAGTVIFAITIIVWALSYYPHSHEVADRQALAVTEKSNELAAAANEIDSRLETMTAGYDAAAREAVARYRRAIESRPTEFELDLFYRTQSNRADVDPQVARSLYDLKLSQFTHEQWLAEGENELAGAYMRDSYLARVGRAVEPVFAPLGWDWRISMAVLASFPAREVIVATLGTIYNLGTDEDGESTTLIDKLRNARWESGPKTGKKVFGVPVALSIVVFFALCCQCGATLVTIRQEAGRWFWASLVFVYMTTLAYSGSLVVYQLFSRVG